ncbi:MarR family winged helix-turn-helix transcriptional regulator [Luteimicrobium sp. NPDC057192]|uniref:MarR family winged helix-turn-helix transcriptional regulator n=1 Tax=Luteimicrobium sp. NPDC057192 TaxID=3346042 RepID=UPI00364106BE
MASTLASAPRLAFFDDLVRCETRLYNAVGERLRVEHGLTTAQYELLHRLADRPASRVADLAAYFAAGVGAVSKMVDRSEARGWVRRVPNPDDRRSSLIELTATGAALVVEARRTFDARLRELLEPALAPGEVAVVASALARLRGSLEEARVGLPVG